MIYYSDQVEELIEGVYLGEELSTRTGCCGIYVNPANIKYLVGKIVIINRFDYDPSNIGELCGNGCKVISRVWIGDQRVSYQPYIIRVDEGISWNGLELETGPDGDVYELLRDNYTARTNDRGGDVRLFFPKIYDVEGVLDERGNLSGLGWALHQVGVNIGDQAYKDLDVLKTKKLL